VPAVELHATRCAICGTAGNAIELYPATIDLEALNPTVFSARRMPDGIHHRMVTCRTCGLVRADPILAPQVLQRLYQQSPFDDSYIPEVANLRHTYGQRLAGLARYDVRKGPLLEVGCGTGFLLEEALSQGYAEVHGVDPGLDAVARASPSVQPNIVCDIMRPGVFESEQFDVVCLFHVFDHIPDPGALLDECWRVLKPGGLILALNHNVQAVSARLLKERSPIVIIQHTYLFSPATMARIFTAHGFAVCHVRPTRDRFTLRYLAHLTPLPPALKRILRAALDRLPIGRISLSVPLGNVELVARKPEAH
jgi:2-polyprenyl-3-methyl-5-hydroxy-6-metoxy-1,4-benzoquinol methylase